MDACQDALMLERQWVISQARSCRISESDKDYQLGVLTFQELSLWRDLESVKQVVDILSKHQGLFRSVTERREHSKTTQQGVQPTKDTCHVFRHFVFQA